MYENSIDTFLELDMSQYKRQNQKETDGIIRKTHEG